MKKQSVNCGSAIIEMTFLIPILLGIIYLYITFFLFLIESSQYKEWIVESLYCSQETQGDTSEQAGVKNMDGIIKMSKQGTQISVFVNQKAELFDIELEMHRKEDSAVKNIRRWQLASDMLRTGEDE